MADEFTVESRTTEAIEARHVVYGHRYTFRVWEHPRHRMLRAGWVHTNAKASLPTTAFQTAGRTFAEREARKADLID